MNERVKITPSHLARHAIVYLRQSSAAQVEHNRESTDRQYAAFAARPSDLPPRPLMVMDFAISSSLVRPGRPRYPVFVHRAAALLHAFFRPHLAMTPLRFANPSPPSGWIEDFHLQAVVHTRHTTGSPAFAGDDSFQDAQLETTKPLNA